MPVDVVFSLIRAFVILFGVSAVIMMVTILGMAVWVRREVKGKIFAFFLEPNRELTTEVISVDNVDNPEAVHSKDGGDYLIEPSKMFWYSWPPGFPQWVREPMPSAVYVRNRAEPVDPSNIKQQVTAKSLRYMMDEKMLKQTWNDAREAIGEGSALNKNNIAMYISGASLLVSLGVAYVAWIVLSRVEEIHSAIVGLGG